MKKRKLDVAGWIKRRNKSTDKSLFRVDESRASKPYGPGNHRLEALKMRKGFVKPKTIAKLERIAHKKKKRRMEGF